MANKNYKTLYTGGRFDDNGGKPSKIAEVIFDEVKPYNQDIEYHNGGYFKELEKITGNIGDYQQIYWFADVPNDKPKLVGDIKKRNQTCVLITSKRNVDQRYSFQDLISHALGNKSNLFVEFSREGNRYYGRVCDPLSNVFVDYEEDFDLVGKVLGKRANEILECTRISSKRAGEGLEIPDEKEFFEIIKKYADTFHDLIHPSKEATNRFMGNASFRCKEGFPSFKVDDLIFVSRRNVDKRYIDKNAFVPVQQGKLPVKYYGDYKPSIDTPVQIKLYNYYQNARYMIHSHTYVDEAPFTDKIIPCGALEEVNEIVKLLPFNENVNFSVNLKGHGSLVIADSLEYLKTISYTPRDVPEIHSEYMKIFE